jgi:hypothetical protein
VVQYRVSIFAPNRRATGVKILGNSHHPFRGNIRWQIRIDAEEPLPLGSGCLGVEMTHLTRCVDPSVRSSGSVYGDGLIRDGRDGGPDHMLHRPAVALHLPADEIRAVILQTERDPRHQKKSGALTPGKFRLAKH